MSDAKPTPGPWVLSDRYGVKGVFAARDATWEFVANAHGAFSSVGRKEQIAEQDANARLIAAACNSYQRRCKDPLAAAEGDLLGEALAFIRAVEGDLEGLAHELTARAILAKAEGKS